MATPRGRSRSLLSTIVTLLKSLFLSDAAVRETQDDRFEAHEESVVTALAWNLVVLATGSVSGTAMVWDALTLEPLGLFSFPDMQQS